MNKDKCDETVFKKGNIFAIMDASKQEAEDFCIKQTEETGMQFDWHYSGGRVMIKYLPLEAEYYI